MEILNYDKNFLTYSLFFSVPIEKKSKASPEAAIQMRSLKKVFIEKNNKVGKILEEQL